MFFSATLQASDLRRLVGEITEFPTWVDLKGGVNIPDVRPTRILRRTSRACRHSHAVMP